MAQLELERDAANKDCSTARTSLQAALQDVENLKTEKDCQFGVLQSTQDLAAQLEADVQSLSNEHTSLSEQLKVPRAFQYFWL